MKTAALCIAAEFERPYLEEWWSWHHSLGFDDIHVITNNWTLDIPAPSFVHSFRVDGQVVQLPAYNAWLQKFKEKYDWLLVIDVDEFLWMPDDLKTYLELHQKDYCIGVPWVHFGDGFSKETSGSVIQRF